MKEGDWLGLGIVAVVLVLVLSRRNAGPVQQIENKETWEWTDWRGQQRTITVHRDVKAT